MNPIRSLFAAVGLDVRWKRNLERHRAEEKRQAVLRPWRYLMRYQPRTLLDIGANDGHSAVIFRELMPDARILSFEPLADCFAKVDAFLNSNPPGQALHFALGESEGSAEIHRSEFTPSSSLLPMADLHKEEMPYTAESTVETVAIRRLDDVAAGLALEGPIVAKIDVQGFEDRVIRGGHETLARTSCIVVELSSYPLYDGQPSYESVFAQLNELGFVFRGVLDQMLSPKDGRILQFDCIFENEKLLGSAN